VGKSPSEVTAIILSYSVTFKLVMSILELLTQQMTEDPIFLVA